MEFCREFECCTVREDLEEAFWDTDNTFVVLSVGREQVDVAFSFDEGLKKFKDYLDRYVFVFDEVEDETGLQGYEINVLSSFA